MASFDLVGDAPVASPDYAYRYLPGSLMGGTGVGLTIPSLSAAAAPALPPSRFATGSAVAGMARQFGSALGIAILVAIVGTPGPSEPLDAFRHAWLFVMAAALASGALSLGLGRVRVEDPETVLEPAAA